MDIELLHEERLAFWSRRLDLPEGAREVLAALAGEVLDDADLLRVFRACHERTAVRCEWHREWSSLPFDPGVEARLGQRTSLFYLLVYLAALPYAEATYRRRGIDPAILDATMQDFRIWLVQAHDVHGDWRFDQFEWLGHHLSCELFRLGRLQFMLGTFSDGVTALRARNGAGLPGSLAPADEIVLLADPNVPLREDGYAQSAGDHPPTGQPWHPVFEAGPLGWRGHVISPRGHVLREPAFFPAAGWEAALQKGDLILDIHIPRGDPFSPADCQDSLRQAHEFFAQQAPDRPFRAGFCHTWFFSPQLQQLLPPESNIVRFQREFYLYPFPGKLGFLWSYVFGEKYPQPACAPRDTALRQAVLDWLEGGGEVFDLPGLMFHGPEAWGTQPYMRRWEKI